MAQVSIKMVEKAGIDVKKLLDLLVRNASAELTTYYYYTILRVNLIGLDGEGLKAITEDARIEDRNHFEALVPRIYELGGELPRSMVDFHNISACPPAFLPKDPTNIKAMLKVLVNAERCAVAGYSEICNMTAGKDHRTYDLALAILHEEIEHEAWFAEFLGEGPSGHGGVRTMGHSPYVKRFLPGEH
ncbi:MAG: DNA protection during starvation protein [Ignavibacteria bacterium]|nr:DNA protection during starvation protein [Ignavibacteria bacterium]